MWRGAGRRTSGGGYGWSCPTPASRPRLTPTGPTCCCSTPVTASRRRRGPAAGQLRDAITASLDQAAVRLGRPAMPAAPGRGFDAGMIGSLVASAPLGLLPPDDPWVTGTLEVVRERFCLGDGFYDSVAHTG